MKSEEEAKENPAKAPDADEPDGPQAVEVAPTPVSSSAPAKAANPKKAAKPVKAVKAIQSKSAQSKSGPRKAAKATGSSNAPKAAAVKPAPAKTAKPALKSKASKKPKTADKVKTAAKATPKPKASQKSAKDETAKILDSKVVYEGKLFRVLQDHLIEPGGRESHRDVIRHNGSVVILAVDPSKRKKDPWVVIERQYRHAAGQFLWELPAGKLDPGEAALTGAIRELAEETGYEAGDVQLIGSYRAEPARSTAFAYMYLATNATRTRAPLLDPSEVIEVELEPLESFRQMLRDGRIDNGASIATGYAALDRLEAL